MLKRSITFIFLAFAGFMMTVAQNCNVDNIIPKPESIVMGNRNSTFEFNADTRIVYNWDNSDVKPAIKELDRIAIDLFGKKMSKGIKKIIHKLFKLLKTCISWITINQFSMPVNLSVLKINLFVSFVSFQIPILAYHIIFIFAWLTSLSMKISRSTSMLLQMALRHLFLWLSNIPMCMYMCVCVYTPYLLYSFVG